MEVEKLLKKADKKLKESNQNDPAYYFMVFIPMMALLGLSIFLVFRHDNPTIIDIVPLIIAAIYWTWLFHKYNFGLS